MSEEENDYAPGWRPTAGDEVEGTIVELSAREKNRPKPGDTHYPILTIEKADGEQVAVHAFHTVLEREIKDHFKPTELIGSHIRVRYEGEKNTKNGENTYHLYKVFGGTQKAESTAALLNWGGTVARSSEPPIPAYNPAEDYSPLPKSGAPTTQEKAAAAFGDKAPWDD